MINNFKNPFQSDEENSTMIPLGFTEHIDATQRDNINPTPIEAATIPPTKLDALLTPNDNDLMSDVLNPSIHQETSSSELNQNDDPPLLQDIGIDLQKIKKRLIAVVTLQKADKQIITSPDLSGPILISLALGCLLLLGGKAHFSDIEAEFFLGNFMMYLLFNFMTKTVETIPLYSVMSFLGYSLLPMLLLALFGIFTTLNNAFGILTSLCLAAWCSKSAGQTMSVLLQRESSKLLLMYPLFLFYLSFAMIVIF